MCELRFSNNWALDHVGIVLPEEYDNLANKSFAHRRARDAYEMDKLFKPVRTDCSTSTISVFAGRASLFTLVLGCG